MKPRLATAGLALAAVGCSLCIWAATTGEKVAWQLALLAFAAATCFASLLINAWMLAGRRA